MADLDDVLLELREISRRLTTMEAWSQQQRENITRFWSQQWPALEKHIEENGKVCTSIDKRLALVESEMHRITQLDTRLAKVEAKQNWILGVVAAVAGLAGWLAKVLHLDGK